MTHEQIIDFISESNRIEGIERAPSHEEVSEFKRFMALSEVTVWDLIQFVSVYEPSAQLRDRVGLNVRIGNHTPPPGGRNIEDNLAHLLNLAKARLGSHETHIQYEALHPFTDCNGRSGRMLWMYMMREAPLGFLHTYYYQSLSASR